MQLVIRMPGDHRILKNFFQSRSRSRSKTIPENSVIDFHFNFDQRFPDQNRSLKFIFKSIYD